MIVYAVIGSWSYQGGCLRGIFSTEELANTFAKRMESEYYDYVLVTTFTVDDENAEGASI